MLENLGIHFVLKAFFVDMAWTPKLGSTVTVSSLMRTFLLDKSHKALLHTLLIGVEEFGVLKFNNHSAETLSWTVTRLPPPSSNIQKTIKLIQTQLLAFPECSTEAEFLNYTGSNLYSVLRGEVSGLEILFPPESSPHYKFGANNLYTNSMLMEHSKTIYIIEGILQTLRAVDPSQEIVKILEIGAGTGGTTVPLLSAISADPALSSRFEIHYNFSDISNFFVTKAKARLETLFPKVHFQYSILDIEVPQPIVAGTGFDIIVAADVFHATQYMDDTLRHTRALVKPGGILILGEIFKSSLFLELSFGMTEGWWRYGDDFRQMDGPLLSEAGWDGVLRKFGFGHVFTVGHGNYGVVFAKGV